MDRFGARAVGRSEQPLDVEIALRGRGRAEQVRLVGIGDVQGARIALRIDGHRADAELAERPEDADRDLAAVRHEHLFEHERRILPTGWHRPTS